MGRPLRYGPRFSDFSTESVARPENLTRAISPKWIKKWLHARHEGLRRWKEEHPTEAKIRAALHQAKWSAACRANSGKAKITLPKVSILNGEDA